MRAKPYSSFWFSAVLSFLLAACSASSSGGRSSDEDDQIDGDASDNTGDTSVDETTNADTVQNDVQESDVVDTTTTDETMRDGEVADEVAVDESSSDGDSHAPDESTDTAEDGADDMEIDTSFCAEVCPLRDSDDSFCTQEGYFTVAACNAYCADMVSDWGEVEEAAFRTCVSTDPLCFQEIGGCMMNDLFSDELDNSTPVNQVGNVRGVGFGASNDLQANAEFSRSFRASSTDQDWVDDGEFELEWRFENEVPYDGQLSARVYIDVNENSACDAEGDMIFGDALLARFGTSPLRYELVIRPADEVESFMRPSVCDAFGD